jgi:hypothetical protein
MGLFDKLKGPVFLKETSDAKEQLEQLKELYTTAPNEIKEQIEQDINMLSYGINGEDNVAFELKNSFIPMVVLHDLHFLYEDLSAQIDYLIVTKKLVFVIECKNMIGNIEVNSNGDFIRTFDFGRKKRKEGIYSPITQNKRHLDILRMIRRSDKSNFITKAIFDRYFDSSYKSVVVLANKKTIINMKYAKKEVKEQIIRCDQLIDYIKKIINASSGAPMSDKDMYEIADSFLIKHTPNTTDYTKKYGIVKIDKESEKHSEAINNENIVLREEITTNQFDLSEMAGGVETNQSSPQEHLIMPEIVVASNAVKIEDTPIYLELKAFRYAKSKEENMKAFYVFNNAQMEDIIKVMPKNRNELKIVNGFSDQKCDKYGVEILRIVNKFV